MRSERLRQIVEEGGAIFVGIQQGHADGDIVLFQSAPQTTTRAMFAFACKEPRDVRLALRAERL